MAPGLRRPQQGAAARPPAGHGRGRLRHAGADRDPVLDAVDDLRARAGRRQQPGAHRHGAGHHPRPDRAGRRRAPPTSSSSTPTSAACSSGCSPPPASSTSCTRRTGRSRAIEIEREITPQLATIADAQVNFLNQGGGGPGGGGRAIILFLGSADPVKLEATANKLADEMATLPELVAPRVQGDNVRPEIVIKPRFDLAADLGVTTSALSQTIRIATIGDIAQNSAKFSLADRQVPISVSLSENSRARPVDAGEPAGADGQRRLGAAEVGRADRLRIGPGHRPADQPGAPDRRSAPTWRPAWSAATPTPRSTSCRR